MLGIGNTYLTILRYLRPEDADRTTNTVQTLFLLSLLTVYSQFLFLLETVHQKHL